MVVLLCFPDLTFGWYKDPMVFRVYIFIICLEQVLGIVIWMRATSASVMLIFLKVLFWKSLDHNYIQSLSSTIVRYTGKSILKDTLQLNISRTRIKIRPNSFIKTWVSIVKEKSTKVPWKLLLTKKCDLDFKEHCTKVDDVSLIVLWFFFSQTKLVFQSNSVFHDILDSSCHSLYLHSYLFIVDDLKCFNFIQCLSNFFIKSSKILVKLNIVFSSFSAPKCSYYISFPMKHSHLSTEKIARNNSF